MKKYDSSVETKKHILAMGRYMDIITNNLRLRRDIQLEDINLEINNVTLVDLVSLLYLGKSIPDYDEMFRNLNINSSIYLQSIYETKGELLERYLLELNDRRINHDKTKLESPEKEEFDIWTPKLRDSTYGSPEYMMFLKELRKALLHHYRYNRHHPEHFGNGISGMNIMDLVELLCDWKASSERHDDGDIFRSIEFNKNRFEYGDAMVKVLTNTTEKYLIDK